jgi:prophage tail gpP-like protein
MIRNDDAILSVGGRNYGGWKEIEVVRSLDSLASAFSLTAAAREDGSGADFQFQAGAACTISIGGLLLITGWVDQVVPDYDDASHSVTISGRSRAADLIDCAAVATPGSWQNARIEAIAEELAKPFGIAVTVRADTGPPLKKFALQQGESVQQAIERMLRYRGLLMTSTPAGDVEIFAPKQSGIDFALDPGRIKRGQATHDVSNRFSDYIVKGQSSGDDETNGAAASKLRAEATDPAVKRYRPTIIIGEEQSTVDALNARAKWEASVRAAQSQGAIYDLAGWYADGGRLFVPDMLCTVGDPRLFIDSPMLVSEVNHRKGGAGTVTQLTLVPPEAFSQLPIPEEREASRLKKGGR